MDPGYIGFLDGWVNPQIPFLQFHSERKERETIIAVKQPAGS